MIRYIILSVFMISVVAATGIACLSALAPIFKSSPVFNTLICALVTLGSGTCLYNLFRITRESQWFKRFQTGEVKGDSFQPFLFLPLKTNFIINQSELTTETLKATLQSISGRLQSTRTLSRYLISLPIVIGLLGTFWGLSLTIGAISTLMSAVPADGALGAAMTNSIKAISSVSGSMGLAFSSSLFGLAGSLLLGFLEVQVSMAYANAYTTMETWLLGCIDHNESKEFNTAESPTFLKSLSSKTLEAVDKLQKITTDSKTVHESTNTLINTLSGQLIMLTEQMRVEQQLMIKLAENQVEVQNNFRTFVADIENKNFGLTEATQRHIETMSKTLQALRDDLTHSRSQSMGEIRDEIHLLSHTLSVINDDQKPVIPQKSEAA